MENSIKIFEVAGLNDIIENVCDYYGEEGVNMESYKCGTQCGSCQGGTNPVSGV